MSILTKIGRFFKTLFYPTIDELPEPCKNVYKQAASDNTYVAPQPSAASIILEKEPTTAEKAAIEYVNRSKEVAPAERIKPTELKEKRVYRKPKKTVASVTPVEKKAEESTKPAKKRYHRKKKNSDNNKEEK